jgi:hypothetical protein
MEKQITKVSETQVEVKETVTKVVDIEVLNQELESAKKALSDFEAWVIDERTALEADIDAKTSVLKSANDTSVGASAQVASIEAVVTPVTP